MHGERVSNDEFDYIIELIAAILFMSIGIFGIVFMVRQFQRQVELNTRVDKVRVSSIDQEDKDPFYFTAYQAYMFSWMMDGHDKTALYYFANYPEDVRGDNPNTGGEGKTDMMPGGSKFPGSGSYIGLCPAELANGFIVVRNRAITGDGEYGGTGSNPGSSVKNTIYKANGNYFSESNPGSNADRVTADYMGAPGYGKRWHLTFTDDYVGVETTEYTDYTENNVFEVRKDYIWSLHPCNPDSH